MAPKHKDRLGVLSFYIDDLHYNCGVKLLNDRFGIQTRGGCSCAGTYGHFLLHVDHETSNALTEEISIGDMARKPGWIRMSIHPTTTNAEVNYVCESILELAKNHELWQEDYTYDKWTNEFTHKANAVDNKPAQIESWFTL